MRHGETKEDTQKPASKRDQHSLDDELADDVPSSGADRAAHTDFTRALENSRQHDVHDPDPADEKRNGSDGHHNGVEKLLGAFLLCEQLGGDDHVEVPRVVM